MKIGEVRVYLHVFVLYIYLGPRSYVLRVEILENASSIRILSSNYSPTLSSPLSPLYERAINSQLNISDCGLQTEFICDRYLRCIVKARMIC